MGSPAPEWEVRTERATERQGFGKLDKGLCFYLFNFLL